MIVLAAAAGINRTIDSLANRSMPSMDLAADQKIRNTISNGNWDSVNIERLAGTGSWFTVLDGPEILYRSKNMPADLSFSFDDIACIPALPGMDGKGQLILLCSCKYLPEIRKWIRFLVSRQITAYHTGIQEFSCFL